MSTSIPLAITRWGDGSKRILLLHGMSSSAAGWWRLAASLVDRGYEVWAPDLRGHGASGRGDTLSLEAYRDDVLDLAPAWDVVLGHSLGGAVALHALYERPGWAKAMILEDPALVVSDAAEAMEWLAEPWTKPIDVAAVAAEHPGWHHRDVEIKVDALRQCGRETVVRTVADATPWDVRPLLDALTVPTLLVAADPQYGAMVSPELGEAVSGAYPAVHFDTVVGGSHSMHRDAYDEFWVIVDRFLGGLEG